MLQFLKRVAVIVISINYSFKISIINNPPLNPFNLYVVLPSKI